MSKLDDLRELGYGLSLLPGEEIDIDFPPGQERTQKLVDRLGQLKPILIHNLKDEQSSRKDLYRFLSYSTRKDKHGNGRLVMELISDDTGEVIQVYFNVNITYQRGAKKGKYFKTGLNGRFWVLPRSKFATFWIQAIGQPDRWSTLYRQMSHLKPLYFSGELKSATTYQQLINIKMVPVCR